jgi:hypothetical protein
MHQQPHPGKGDKKKGRKEQGGGLSDGLNHCGKNTLFPPDLVH